MQCPNCGARLSAWTRLYLNLTLGSTCTHCAEKLYLKRPRQRQWPNIALVVLIILITTVNNLWTPLEALTILAFMALLSLALAYNFVYLVTTRATVACDAETGRLVASQRLGLLFAAFACAIMLVSEKLPSAFGHILLGVAIVGLILALVLLNADRWN